MNRFEKAKRVIPGLVLLGLGASACGANADSAVKKPAATVCETVKPAYEHAIAPGSILITPEPGLNSQYYMFTEVDGNAHILQKEVKADATEAEKMIDLNNIEPGEVRMVSFADATPGVTMEFKAEYMQSPAAGQVATLIMPMVCSLKAQSQTL